MKMLRPFLALLLAAPFVASGASSAPEAAAPAAAPQGIVAENGPAQECCWVYYHGMWYCVPC